ncbi:hypothetical protein FRC07_008888 [Ceratobasidium sp. 392]|nr:hypothetical protein FRC07_008888 [Ceratobasidium sp. 392]
MYTLFSDRTNLVHSLELKTTNGTLSDEVSEKNALGYQSKFGYINQGYKARHDGNKEINRALRSRPGLSTRELEFLDSSFHAGRLFGSSTWPNECNLVSQEITSPDWASQPSQDALSSVDEPVVLEVSRDYLLPPELLIYIFTLANDCCLYDLPLSNNYRRTEPTLFTSICTYWRQLALDAGALWSHIDLSLDQQTKDRSTARALFLRERARGTPLHLHVCQVKDTDGHDLAAVNRFLLHSANRTRSLDVSLAAPLYELYHTTLICVDTGCVSGSMKSWKLHNKNNFELLGVDTNNRSRQDKTPPNYIQDARLLSLTALDISGVFIEWNSVAYHGLLDLRIEGLPEAKCPTIAQLAAVLEASPRLRILKLADIVIRDGGSHPTLVRLEYLQKLDLRRLPTSHLCTLLEIIRPGRAELNASLKLNDELHTIHVASAFFQRSNITTLFVDGYSCRYYLPHLLRIPPNLQQLVLYSYDITRSEFPDLAETTFQADIPILWPNLRALKLVECRLDASILYELVDSHRICKLRMWRCYLDPSLHGNDLWDWGSLMLALRDIVSDAQHSEMGTWAE